MKNKLFTIGVEEEYMICNPDSYELYDIRGRVILIQNHLNKKNFEIDISNLDSDIYILNTYSETKHESFKILKN